MAGILSYIFPQPSYDTPTPTPTPTPEFNDMTTNDLYDVFKEILNQDDLENEQFENFFYRIERKKSNELINKTKMLDDLVIRIIKKHRDLFVRRDYPRHNNDNRYGVYSKLHRFILRPLEYYMLAPNPDQEQLDLPNFLAFEEKMAKLKISTDHFLDGNEENKYSMPKIIKNFFDNYLGTLKDFKDDGPEYDGINFNRDKWESWRESRGEEKGMGKNFKKTQRKRKAKRGKKYNQSKRRMVRKKPKRPKKTPRKRKKHKKKKTRKR
jgi:hypothetical protein